MLRSSYYCRVFPPCREGVVAIGQDVRLSRRAREDRILRQLAVTTLCGFMVWMGVVVRRPYLEADKMVADNQAIERKMFERQIELQGKERELRSLQTDAGMEKEARRAGFVRKGESMLVIPDRK